ncbi:helix-turn-helix domain-containing protein [Frankia sp. Cas3]|uniref:helix-turn-helix domain-containing protein n=1 Tax=Frankia sp. Cas3 TaxID=3073926 RepID=UPI002AD336B2|nr:helix-turn-helix domain-containing protein [Frankia sp. Cas3]
MALRELLKIEEREIISRELSRHKSARYIGQILGRHHVTRSREIDRNGGVDGTFQSGGTAVCVVRTLEFDQAATVMDAGIRSS